MLAVSVQKKRKMVVVGGEWGGFGVRSGGEGRRVGRRKEALHF